MFRETSSDLDKLEAIRNDIIFHYSMLLGIEYI